MERLQRKFALIHATLAQQTAMGSTPNKAADFAERLSLMSLAESASITAMGARMKASGRSVGTCPAGPVVAPRGVPAHSLGPVVGSSRPAWACVW